MSTAAPGGAPGQDHAPGLVVLCGDTLGVLAADRVAAQLAAWGLPVVILDDLCGDPRALRPAVERLRASRVVVACRHGRQVRSEIALVARRAGAYPGAVAVVELSQSGAVRRQAAAAEAEIRIGAAARRVLSVDIEAVIETRLAAGAAGTSRRGLLRLGAIGRRPVASWAGGEGTPSMCQACISSCPTDALTRDGNVVRVDDRRCIGCGVCVAVCPGLKLSLNGRTRAGFEAELQALVDQMKRPNGPHGIAICCTDGPAVPLGHGWLPFEVPSLRMVTAGWVLQILAAGAAVTTVSCHEPECAARGHELTVVAEALPTVPLGPREPAPLSAPAEGADIVTLHEPDATIRALSVLTGSRGSVGPRDVAGSVGGGRDGPPPAADPGRAVGTSAPGGWELESAALSVGDVTVDTARCSGCRRCVDHCAPGALTADDQQEAEFALNFDPALCSACGACVTSCPEAALSLRRVARPPGSERVMRSPVFRRRVCRNCGAPLGAGLDAALIATRLAASHPALADRLSNTDRCADCLLKS